MTKRHSYSTGLLECTKALFQHENTLAAPKCMNNLKYVRCMGEDQVFSSAAKILR